MISAESIRGSYFFEDDHADIVTCDDFVLMRIFMTSIQDGAPAHTARETMEVERGIFLGLLIWPAHSPNPIIGHFFV